MQLISAIFLATSRDAGRTSLAYLIGAGVTVLAGVTIAYGVVSSLKGATGGRGGGKGYIGSIIDWIVLGLLVVLLVVVFLRRKRSQPPRWMGRLETATPGFAAKLGVLLFLLMPSDIITMVTVGASMARGDRPWWHLLPFILLTLLLLALPALALALFGSRARAALPKVRDWANANSWLVSEFAIVFFIGITVSSLLA